MGLGSTRLVTTDVAEGLVAKYVALIAEGFDPRAVRDAERIAAGEKPVRAVAAATRPFNFREAARAYVTHREAEWKDPLQSTQWTRMLRKYAYPIIGDVRLDKITVDHMVVVLEPIWQIQHPTALKLKSRIAQVLDWAEAKQWRSGDNVAKAGAVVILLGKGVNRTVHHYKAIHYPQLPAFWAALAEDLSVAADVLRFQLLTATRPSDALGALWAEINLGQMVWTIPAERMKMDREHRVPLSSAALSVLERRKGRMGSDASGIVFPGNGGKLLSRSVPLTTIKKLGYDATAHGTARSSFTDWAAEVAGADFETREQALAHQERSKTVRAYRRSDLLEPRRVLMQQWADYVAGKANS